MGNNCNCNCFSNEKDKNNCDLSKSYFQSISKSDKTFNQNFIGRESSSLFPEANKSNSLLKSAVDYNQNLNMITNRNTLIYNITLINSI